MFISKKRFLALERKLGLVYVDDPDFDYYTETVHGNFDDIENRLNKLEDKLDGKPQRSSIK
jgi:hypothetical protein